MLSLAQPTRRSPVTRAHRLGDDLAFYARNYERLGRQLLEYAVKRSESDPSNTSSWLIRIDASELEPLERVLRIAEHMADTGARPVAMHPVRYQFPYVLAKQITVLNTSTAARLQIRVSGGPFEENRRAFEEVSLELPPGFPPVAREITAAVGDPSPEFDSAFNALLVPRQSLDATLASFRRAGYAVDQG